MENKINKKENKNINYEKGANKTIDTKNLFPQYNREYLMGIIKELQTKNKGSIIIKEILLNKIKNYYSLFSNISSQFNLKEALIEYAHNMNNKSKMKVNIQPGSKVAKKSIGRQFKKDSHSTLDTENRIRSNIKENLGCIINKVEIPLVLDNKVGDSSYDNQRKTIESKGSANQRYSTKEDDNGDLSLVLYETNLNTSIIESKNYKQKTNQEKVHKRVFSDVTDTFYAPFKHNFYDESKKNQDKSTILTMQDECNINYY